ncbi:MAG: putative photosynthetic complex assembly protein PuhE [Paracoccaceae bacterium]
MSPWIAAFIALFVWWFSTGAILMAVKYADFKGPDMRRRATLIGFALVPVGAYGMYLSVSDMSIFGVYIGFLAALALWGWIELAFLTGAITGPNTHPLPANVSEGERFVRAWGTVAYHEMLLLAALLLLVLGSSSAVNHFGVWTFAVLYFARISAKLNLYLGVPKIQIEFLPDALSHLPSHFRIRVMNWLFPVSVTGLSFAIACWLERLYAATSPGEITGFALLTALTALALFEHWMMVVPIPDERLWRWMIPDRTSTPKSTIQTRKTGGQHGL